MVRPGWIVIGLLLALGTWSARAGGGPQNVLVVVNQNSSNSIALGRHYAQTRGIPDRQILRLATTNDRNMTLAAFTNEIRDPIFAYLDETGLDDQVDYVVFSRDVPYRVFDGAYTSSLHAGMTSVMYYDFFSSPNAFVSGCNLASGSSNAYFAVEQPFRRPDPPVQPRYRISALLTASTPTQSWALVQRAASADFTRPNATVYFEHGEDFLRNGRWTQYEDAAFDLAFVTGGPNAVLVDGVDGSTPRTNAIGLMTGLQSYPRFPVTSFVPGALAEHLTSFSGFLFNDTEGEGYREPSQMKILAWVSNGVAGSYGTVVEPCAYDQKFPRAQLHAWYGRGFSLGESFYMALENPYQGILVGDPLTQPYAIQPEVTLAGLAENEVVTNDLVLSVTGRVTGASGGVDRLDLYVDGQFQDTFARFPAVASNVITVTINSQDRSYTVQPGDAVPDMAAGLAGAINAAPTNLPVRAIAGGDHVMLQQKNLGESGTGITYGVVTSLGVATNLGVMVWTPGTNLLESPFYAHTAVRMVGIVQSGFVFRAEVTRLDAVVVTNEVMSGASSTAWTVMQDLQGVINSNVLLQGSNGCRVARYSRNPYTGTEAEVVFESRLPGWSGYAPSVLLTSSNPGVSFSGGGLFDDNTNVLTARGCVYFSAGAATVSASFVLSATNLPDGPHELRIVAHRGDGAGTQGSLTRSFRVDRHTLECAITQVSPGTNLNLGLTGTVEVTASDSGATVTGVTLYAEGKLVGATNTLPAQFALDTAYYGLGSLALQAKAFNDMGQATLSDPVLVLIRPPVTSNGTPHAWLIENGITNDFEAASLGDQDQDGVITGDEYVMDTHPLGSNSYLRMSSVSFDANLDVVSWLASSNRMYSLFYVPDLLANWLAVTGVQALAGQSPLMVATNAYDPLESQRFYRVQVTLP